VAATAAATAITTAAATAAAVIAVATAAAALSRAATMRLRAAADYGLAPQRRRWFSTLAGLGVDILELGALMLQMLLMTQWVFGEFSIMPVMSTLGMMFALLHNFHGYSEVFWWEGAI
jgi:hypothetical protein